MYFAVWKKIFAEHSGIKENIFKGNCIYLEPPPPSIKAPRDHEIDHFRRGIFPQKYVLISKLLAKYQGTEVFIFLKKKFIITMFLSYGLNTLEQSTIFFKQSVHFEYITIRDPLECQNPWPSGHEFHNLSRELTVYYNNASSLKVWCKKDFIKIMD